ncbi:MAG: hypothetical protein JWM12_1691, partial [Ilumatobacteraceae bacterium]|nr:hypothetical protein [Ilumatobacteraceae bacterium]
MTISWKPRLCRSLLAMTALGAVIAPVAAPEAAAQVVPRVADTVSPTRILDTRDGTGVGAPGKVVPGRTLTLAVPGAAVGATSVVLNVTATEADGPGWVKVWPCGSPEPATSSLNFVPGRIAANAVAVKLDGVGVCIATYAPVHIVADVSGWFTGSFDFTGTAPNRILDTRVSGDPLTKGVERRIKVAGTANIPANAAVVALNLTVVEPSGAGWVVAYPCGQPSSSSTVNFNSGEIVANLTIVGLNG